MAVTTPAGLVAKFLAVNAQVQVRAAMACNKAALDTQRDARVLAPVDTGNLRGSIQVRPASAALTEATVGPEAEYGVYVEYGTSRMAAQPYMRPAADRHGPAFVQAFERMRPL